MRSMSAWAPGPNRKSRVVRLDVHRQRGAEVGEARVHLARNRPAPRLRLGVVGEEGGAQRLVQVLADGQRVPDDELVMAQPRHQERRRQQQELGPGVGIVAVDDFDPEVQAGELAQQPTPERPGAVVTAVDGEGGLGHGCSLAPRGPAAPRCVPSQITTRGQFHQWDLGAMTGGAGLATRHDPPPHRPGSRRVAGPPWPTASDENVWCDQTFLGGVTVVTVAAAGALGV